jgi:gas vesicle protein
MTDDRSPGGIILAFLAGAVLGAGVALILAPASGQETREKIKDAARRTREKIDEATAAIRDRVS